MAARLERKINTQKTTKEKENSTDIDLNGRLILIRIFNKADERM